MSKEELQVPIEEVTRPVEVSTGGDEQVSSILPVVTMTLNISDVRKYYAKPGPGVMPDMKDILIYVRRLYPNPRQRVILKCDALLPARDLADSLIYISGVNDNEANNVQGIGYFCYCPIEITPEMMEQEGYGIQQYVDNFCRENNIIQCELLIYGDNIDNILQVWSYIQSSGEVTYTILFPYEVIHRMKLFSNGIDLAPYARSMSQAFDRNALTISFINDVLDSIGEHIKSGKVLLQNFEETRSVYSKWLTLVLTQRYNLVPVYLGSYISEYVSLEAAYPLDKLSMYERFKFVERLPAKVGYIGKYHGFSCIYLIAKKIYPVPAVAFDVKAQEVITEGLDEFIYETLRIADWREWFKGSPTYYMESAKGGRNSKALETTNNDRAIDERLRSIFLKMTAAAASNIYMSVRNSVLALHNGRTYVLYYDQPLGLAGAMVSEHFGSEPMVLQEEYFNHLIDLRVVVAMQKDEEAGGDVGKGTKFTDLMTILPQTFQTAIPLDVLMNCVLVGHGAVELSYYDRRLRCDKNVLPIITHADSALHTKRTVFDHLDVLEVGDDPVAGPIISSFGSINSDSGYLDKIPVSTQTFKRWKLL